MSTREDKQDGISHPGDVEGLRVINLWGGPGAGKSTTAAGLFNVMKAWGYRVELVREVAKDFTYRKDFGSLRNQLLLLGLQDDRLRCLAGQVDWAITDSPLPTGEAYMTPEYADWLPDAIKGAYDRYDNLDFMIRRVKDYETYGRNQTESQALALDIQLRDIFTRYTGGLIEMGPEDGVWEIDGNPSAPYVIAKALGLRNLKEKTRHGR